MLSWSDWGTLTGSGKDQGWLVEALRVPGELSRAFTNRSAADPVLIKRHKTALLLTSAPKHTGAS